jgi:hypothetical protein
MDVLRFFMSYDAQSVFSCVRRGFDMISSNEV